MSEELVKPPTEELPVEVPQGLVVFARTQEELQAGHEKFMTWVQSWKTDLEKERRALAQTIGTFKERKWNWKALIPRGAALKKQIEFYSKLEEALQAGYMVVPNMGMEVFAIRTGEWKPRERGSWQGTDQAAQLLPSGEGEYKDPHPTLVNRWAGKNAKGEDTYKNVPEKWRDPNYPFDLAIPEVMNATSKALARKLFDELGVVRDAAGTTRGWKAGDPLILGRILHPGGRRHVTFFIAWVFDAKGIAPK